MTDIIDVSEAVSKQTHLTHAIKSSWNNFFLSCSFQGSLIAEVAGK